MFRKIFFIPATIILIFSELTFQAHAELPCNAIIETGNDLNCFLSKDKESFWSNYSLGYILGVTDALQYYESNLSFCLPSGTTVGQTQDIVKKYLKEHPEERHLKAESLIIKALKKAFPCIDNKGVAK